MPKKETTNVVKEKVNHFLEMEKVALEIEKKGDLSYASWADVWGTIKKLYPHTQKIRHENERGTLGFIDDAGGFAKVTVSIEPEFGSITTYLPIQDNNNQPIKKESYTFVAPRNEYKKKENIPADAFDIKEAVGKFGKYWKYKINQTVDAMDTNRINKAYQRATVKAIAELTGLGLYIYKGEDLPKVEETKEVIVEKTPEKKSEVINKALEAVGNPQNPVQAKPETKQEEQQSNNDADKIRYEEGERYITEATLALMDKKSLDEVTVDDIKNIGIDLMNKRRCDNKDKVYVALRDKHLIPLINSLPSNQQK